MSFETRARIELAIVIVGSLALFSLPIFLMGSGL